MQFHPVFYHSIPKGEGSTLVRDRRRNAERVASTFITNQILTTPQYDNQFPSIKVTTKISNNSPQKIFLPYLSSTNKVIYTNINIYFYIKRMR